MISLRIEEETIEKVRTALDIVEVVGEYVHLKKSGRNYFGLCPFHQEHTPSFSVSPDKQIFHCFGCGMGGNVFTFLMELEGYNFPEAVRVLAEKAHIPVPESETREEGQRQDDLNPLYHGMELLTKLFHYLLVETDYGKPALQYLKERGFSDETIAQYKIGYALDDWDTQTKFLERRQLPLHLFEQVGMLDKRSFDGKRFDRFRNRVMFPIWDTRGRTVAFAGRVLNDQKPKYLNTPESPIFHKGRLLYGYHLARQVIKQRNEVVLFEGYMDVVKASQAGVTNGVASMGTSLTEEQAGLLTRGAEKIIICYDADQAGVDAAFRAASLLEKYGRTIKIARMIDGLDPDDYITRYGAERFRTDVIGASMTITAFRLYYLRKNRNLNDEGDRLRYIDDVLGVLSELPKAVERDHYLRQLADEFSLSLDALKQQQYLIFRRKKRADKAEPPVGRRLPVKKSSLLPAYLSAERHLIAYMLRHEDVANKVRTEIGGSFYDDLHQAIVAYLYAFYEEGLEPDISAFIQKLPDPDLRARVTDIAMIDIDEDVDEQVIQDYIDQMIKHHQVLVIEEKLAAKNEAEKQQDLDTATKLLAEIIELKKDLQNR
ncbi:DNA primase [Pullulanibacillus sp. KACC 23026]|uniref:DNA primase n=1 Tax=Pullulanibacillus sp. KACC 23026 TaxID=3028315 RepID=UPI0023B09250|nr:DNA primase [Pullulanibacillus sp. KACC 23026]WEG14920.1 DNA primase [Pullulanibacillus sp. KACC 23026]